MHLRRLEQALRVLQTVKERKFSISFWYRNLEGLLDSMPWREQERKPCGFVACAVGHMALDPWFNAEGLTLEEVSGSRNSDLFIFGKYWTRPYEGLGRFFDIPPDEARQLFSGMTYTGFDPTVREVIARIEAFLYGEPVGAQHAP